MMDTVVFPRTYERYKELLVVNRILVACGKMDQRPGRDEHPLLVDWFKDPQAFLLSAPVGAGPKLPESPPTVMDDRVPYAVRSERPPVSGKGRGNGAARSKVDASASRSAVALDPQPAPSPPVTRGANGATDRSPSPAAGAAAAPAEVSFPAVTAPASEPLMPQPPEPPMPPATVYITLRRTGNNVSDFEKLSHLHQVLRMEEGSDEFVVVLESTGQKRVELAFPNERIRFTSNLRREIASIVGGENLRVVQQPGS
jgi:hypothetical protein